MKAVRIHEHGGIEKLRYEEAPQPELTLGNDVVVHVRAAAVNHSDIWVRNGLSRTPVSLPHTLGSDGAGTVVEVGNRVRHVAPGQAVCLYPASGCGECEFCVTDREFMCTSLRVLGEREAGTYAEYVRVPARNCFPIPSRLSFAEAAAVPFVYLTLWRMLVTNTQLKPGEHILILGVAGGVTAAALHIAAYLGARMIVASTRADELARANKMGAEHTINHGAVDFAKEVRQMTGKRGVDVVVDCAGDNWATALAALAKGGRLATCAAPADANPVTDIRRVFWNHLKIFGSTLGSRGEFRQVLNFFKTSEVRPVIQEVRPLREAATAQQALAEGKPFGKIVLQTNA